MLSIFTHPVILLTIGGAAGTNARYWLSVWIHDQKWTTHFPLATLLINVSGSLLLGLLVVPFQNRLPHWWILLGVGFCGGYTTFSTFAFETTALIRTTQRVDLAVLNIVLSVAMSLAVVWLALAGMEALMPARPGGPPAAKEAEDLEMKREP